MQERAFQMKHTHHTHTHTHTVTASGLTGNRRQRERQRNQERERERERQRGGKEWVQRSQNRCNSFSKLGSKWLTHVQQTFLSLRAHTHSHTLLKALHLGEFNIFIHTTCLCHFSSPEPIRRSRVKLLHMLKAAIQPPPSKHTHTHSALWLDSGWTLFV